MASVEIVDETVILVPRELLARAIADRTRWLAWWPGLEVVVVSDRGLAGMSWQVAGSLVGSTAIWLVPQPDGVLVRYELSVDPAEPGSRTVARRLPESPHGRREVATMRRRQAMAWKRVVWALEDELEA